MRLYLPLILTIALQSGCTKQDDNPQPHPEKNTEVQQVVKTRSYEGSVSAIMNDAEYLQSKEKFPGQYIEIDKDPKFIIRILGLSVGHRGNEYDENDSCRYYGVSNPQTKFGFKSDELLHRNFKIEEYEVREGESVVRRTVKAKYFEIKNGREIYPERVDPKSDNSNR